MGYSGSKDFTMARDEIINSALRQLGKERSFKTGLTPIKNQAAEALNALIKAWQAEGIGLWMITEGVLFLQDGKQYYNIGPSGDRSATDFVKTELREDADTSDLVIMVDETTGIDASDVVGIELDDGTIQWTECDIAPSLSDITVKAKLTGDASENNHIYTYPSLIYKPIEIFEARIISDGQERTLTSYSRDDYMALTDKATTGPAVVYYIDYQLVNIRMYLWPVCDNVNDYIKFTARIPVDDFDSATDNAQFPTEWLRALKFNLAYDLCLEYDTPPEKMSMIKIKAEESKRALAYNDKENVSVFFEMEHSVWPH